MKPGLGGKSAGISLLVSIVALVGLLFGCGAPPTTAAAPTAAPAAAPTTARPAAPTSAPAASLVPPAKPAAPTAVPATGQRKPYGTLIVQQSAMTTMAMLPPLGNLGLSSYQNLIYDHLAVVEYDKSSGEYKILPSLATRWETSPDYKNWTFYLKQGVQWQGTNGEFTAEDVKYSVDLLKSPAVVAPSSAAAVLKRVVDSVEIQDPYKVTFHLTSPYSTFLNLLTNVFTNEPLPKKYIEKVGVEEANKKPVGTGPYRLDGLRLGESLTLEASDQHWRQVPYYKTIVFKDVAETSTAVAMLKTGDADIIGAPIPQKDEIVTAGFEARFNNHTTFVFASLGGLWDEKRFPKETDLKTPWRDVRVREAMSIAIDRTEIVKSLYKGQATVAPVVLLMPGTPGYNPDLKPYPYDPARAKKLLADAGYPNGFEFTMYIYPGINDPQTPDLGQALALYWSRIGLRASLSWSDASTINKLAQAKQDARVINPQAFPRVSTPETYFDQFFNPTSRYAINAPEIWQLTEQFQAEGDTAKRNAIGRTIGQKMYDGYWLVPVAWASKPFYVNPKKVGDWPYLEGYGSTMRLEYLKHPGD